MKIKKLREIISGSENESEDAWKLVTLLAEIDDAEVAEFASSIKSAVTKISKSLAQKRKAAEEADALVAQFVAELQSTKSDNSAFEAVVERMKKTRAVKVQQATEIARRFLGEDKQFKSKPEAAKAILKRQISDKRSADRQAHTSGIF